MDFDANVNLFDYVCFRTFSVVSFRPNGATGPVDPVPWYFAMSGGPSRSCQESHDSDKALFMGKLCEKKVRKLTLCNLGKCLDEFTGQSPF